MKKIFFALLLGIAGQAGASTIGDFTWTIVDNSGVLGGGSVVIDTAASAATITGSDCCLIPSTVTSMSTTAASAGTVAFDWSFVDNNFIAPQNFFFWLSDGVDSTVQLSAGISSSGSESFLVAAGNTFGWSVIAALDGFGAGVADITNFAFSPSGLPSPVPLPPAFLLFGAAMGLLGFVRRKKSVV